MPSIIVAYDENRGIGFQGGLPWKPIKDDWAHFKKTTQGGTIIMGRKTWESLPKKPLIGRTNIVVSNTIKSLNNAFVCSSLQEAIEKSGSHVFIIGGAEIYQQAIENNLVDRIIASEIHGVYETDTFFPKLQDNWKRNPVTIENKDFSLVQYKR